MVQLAQVPIKVSLDDQSATAEVNALAAAVNALSAANGSPPVTSMATTAYTLQLSDQGNTVLSFNAGASTLTVPAANIVPFPVGAIIDVYSTGAGGLTVAPGGGVTVNGTLTIAQYGHKTLLKTATNTWVFA